MEEKGGRPGLRVISGAHHFEMAVTPCQIIAAPREKSPFPVDGEVAEEDTYLVMSAPRKVRETREPLMRIMTRVIETQPREPGEVLIKGKRPVRLLAVIHDLNREPTWKETWITHALGGVLKAAEEHRLGSIALPMLGTVHGALDPRRFMMMLGSALKNRNPLMLKRIWLVIPSDTGLQALDGLRNALDTGFGA